MKTAISIPDSIFASAEKLARKLGKSRSELYTQALASYLEENNDELVKARLDQVYESTGSRVDPIIRTLQESSIPKERW